MIVAALPVAIVVAVSGAIAALGDTLYPAASVASGIRQEFSSTASALLRLRVTASSAGRSIVRVVLLGAAVIGNGAFWNGRAAARMGNLVALLVHRAQLAGRRVEYGATSPGLDADPPPADRQSIMDRACGSDPRSRRMKTAFILFAAQWRYSRASPRRKANYEVQVYGSELVPPHFTMVELHSISPSKGVRAPQTGRFHRTPGA